MMRKEHLHSLDMVRGLCAIGVAAYHFMSWRHGYAVESLGAFGVYTFFVLSAVTMLHVYGSAMKDGLVYARIQDFYINRVARILPLLLAAAVASAAVQIFAYESGKLDQAVKAALTGSWLFTLSFPGLLSNVPGAWSLGIEGGFYLMFPIIALFVMHMKPRHLATVLILLLVAQHAFIFFLGQTSGGNFWTYYVSALTFSPFFVAGCIIYKLPRNPNIRNLTFSLSCLAVIFGFSVAFRDDIYRNQIQYLVLTLASFGAVGFAYRSTIPNACHTLSRWLGDISYALYLTHWGSYEIWVRLNDRLGLGLVMGALLFALIAIGVAWLTFIIFERPAKNAIRGLLSKPGELQTT